MTAQEKMGSARKLGEQLLWEIPFFFVYEKLSKSPALDPTHYLIRVSDLRADGLLFKDSPQGYGEPDFQGRKELWSQPIWFLQNTADRAWFKSPFCLF